MALGPLFCLSLSGRLSQVSLYIKSNTVRKSDTPREAIDSFHIVSAHAPNCLVSRYLREKTR